MATAEHWWVGSWQIQIMIRLDVGQCSQTGNQVEDLFGQDFGGGFMRESRQRLAVGRIC